MPTYDLIAKSVLSTATANVTFSNIPQTYADLILVASARFSQNTSIVDLAIRVGNGSIDVAANYNYIEITGAADSSALSGGGAINQGRWNSIANGSQQLANTFCNNFYYFAGYSNTSATKSVTVDSAVNFNSASGAQQIRWHSWNWNNSSAITVMELYDGQYSSNFVAGSSFYLYGIKNT